LLVILFYIFEISIKDLRRLTRATTWSSTVLSLPPSPGSSGANRKQLPPLHVCAFFDPRCALPFHVSCFCKPSIFLSSPPSPIISCECPHWWKVHSWVCVWVANGEWRVLLTSWQVESWVKNTFMESINFCVLICLLKYQNLSKCFCEKEKQEFNCKSLGGGLRFLRGSWDRTFRRIQT
jgi:hypothetical protein